MKIAFFDSGIGGLSVLHHAMRLLPGEDFVFFADEEHVPYGTKSQEEVMGFVDEAFRFLISMEVDAIVVACNTATSVAVQEMRSRYAFPIIGMEPAAKRALDLYGDRRVLVTATPITVKGRKMQVLMEQVDRNHLIDLLPLPMLVEFAERQEFTSEPVEDYLKEAFSPYDFSMYSSVVLGCTHFNYFKDTMRKLLPEHVKLVDGNEGTVRELMRRLPRQKGSMQGETAVEYFYSGRKVEQAEELERIRRYLQRLDEMYPIE